MNVEVEWVDVLPPRVFGNVGQCMEERYAAHLEILRTRPGHWAKIATSVPKTQATQLNKRTKGFEFVNRNAVKDPSDPKGHRERCELYGRFLGTTTVADVPSAAPSSGRFYGCRSGGCGFTCEDMPALTAHAKDKHDRFPSQAERTARER